MSASTAVAGQLDDALTAYKTGSYAKAYRLAYPNAVNGNPIAQRLVGFLLQNGAGVARNYGESVKWYVKEAKQGDPIAQYDLGVSHEYGLGVPQDQAEAVKWYRTSADQGFAKAEYNLGLKYVQGSGVSQDYSEAVRWFRLAANQGLAVAQNNLGFMYEHGWGVQQDYAEALIWYQKADYQGLLAARNNLNNLTTKIMPATPQRQEPSTYSTRVEMEPDERGGLVVPVLIDDAITMRFVVDSGASDVSIPLDVVRKLVKLGQLTSDDFIGTAVYTLADGSTLPSPTFRIHSMKIGDKMVRNLTGNVSPSGADPLLGQSFLSRFKTWSIDNEKQVLTLD
jgi:predicted aspartyl protease